MSIKVSERLGALGSYAFAEVDRRVAELKEEGINVIDFGVGDPTTPTPELIRGELKTAADRHAASGYPPYIGSMEYRTAVANWTQRRFGVALDPATEVSSTVGSKEGVFNFAEAYVNPGDYVIIPTPGYPPYQRGTLFAEGEPFFVPILKENDYLMDFDSIPADVASKAKILWINYPNSPSGRVAPREFFEKAVGFCRDNDIVLASDEAYSEIYFTDEPPHTALEFGREGVIVFNSLSKRSAMTGYRIGWVAGDGEIVAAFRKVKTNVDSGTPWFVQDAAVAALGDEKHVEAMREEYREKRDLLTGALCSAGLTDSRPEATLYIWQKCPEGMSGLDFATALLAPDIALAVTPGEWISDELPDGTNPGAGFVRFAMVPTVEQCREAAKRLGALQI